MFWLWVFLTVWLVGAVYGFVDRWHCWKYRRAEWNSRSHDLISFSDVQMCWLIALWPLAWTMAFIFILLIWMLNGIAWICDKFKGE